MTFIPIAPVADPATAPATEAFQAVNVEAKNTLGETPESPAKTEGESDV